MYAQQLCLFPEKVSYKQSNLSVWDLNNCYYLLLRLSSLSFAFVMIDKDTKKLIIQSLNKDIMNSEPVAMLNFSNNYSDDYLYLSSEHSSSYRLKLLYAAEDFNFSELTSLLYLKANYICRIYDLLNCLVIYDFSLGTFMYSRTERLPEGFRHVFEGEKSTPSLETCTCARYCDSLENYRSRFTFNFMDDFKLVIDKR